MYSNPLGQKQKFGNRDDIKNLGKDGLGKLLFSLKAGNESVY